MAPELSNAAFLTPIWLPDGSRSHVASPTALPRTASRGRRGRGRGRGFEVRGSTRRGKGEEEEDISAFVFSVFGEALPERAGNNFWLAPFALTFLDSCLACSGEALPERAGDNCWLAPSDILPAPSPAPPPHLRVQSAPPPTVLSHSCSSCPFLCQGTLPPPPSTRCRLLGGSSRAVE